VAQSTVISRSLSGMSDEIINSSDSSDSLTARSTQKVGESYPCGSPKNIISSTYRSFLTRVSHKSKFRIFELLV
jgi:hypothetical protein